MKKIAFIILCLLSLTGATCGIVALCKVSPSSDLDFDYLGLLVGILSLVVLFTVGWQIYTIIDTKATLDFQNRYIKHAIKRQEKRINDLKEFDSSLNKKLDDSMNLIKVYRIYQWIPALASLNIESSIPHYLQALSVYDMDNKEDKDREMFNTIISRLKDAISKANLEKLIREWKILDEHLLKNLYELILKTEDQDLLAWYFRLKELFINKKASINVGI